MKRQIRSLTIILAIVGACGSGVATGAEIIAHLRVSAPNADLVDVPVHAVIELPKRLTGARLEEIKVKITQLSDLLKTVSVPGQLVLNEKEQLEVWCVIPRLEANSTSTWTVGVPEPEHPNTDFGPEKAFSWQSDTDFGEKAFSWQSDDADYLDLLFDGRKVTRYMYAYDTSSPQRVFETYKPFHHVFDAQGQNLLTNGPDGVQPYSKDKILYPHHRGIFIGWSRLEFTGSRYDFWGMGGGVSQVHQKFLEQIAGPVLARSTALIHWNDKNGEPIIAEQRQTTVFRQSDPIRGGGLLELRTELKAVRGDVELGGDPEHAGFQYRAHNDVDSGGKEVKATYLFHNDGVDPKKDIDLPWAAMSYRLNNQQYCVLHMDHPSNPRPTIYSAYRDYGRFGAFFTHTIKSGETLKLCYRVWIVGGEMPSRQQCISRYSAFVDCPQVKVLD